MVTAGTVTGQTTRLGVRAPRARASQILPRNAGPASVHLLAAAPAPAVSSAHACGWAGAGDNMRYGQRGGTHTGACGRTAAPRNSAELNVRCVLITARAPWGRATRAHVDATALAAYMAAAGAGGVALEG